MSGDVAFLLKIFFWEAKKIFCRRNINFCVDRIFFCPAWHYGTDGINNAWHRISSSILTTFVTANLPHSFSLTPHPVVEVMNVTSMQYLYKKWNQVAFSIDPSDWVVKRYINGELVAEEQKTIYLESVLKRQNAGHIKN